ncbi:MAG: serine O-acetyltransferase [Succinivibrionaceae bacterium]|nr:serine O-acetyltransferase [Succinivibrionaceae bacterium]
MQAAPSLESIIWQDITTAALGAAREEPALHGMLNDAVLSAGCLCEGCARVLANLLATSMVSRGALEDIFCPVLKGDPGIGPAIAHDLLAVLRRDPAVSSILTPFLYLKGPHALATYRIAHALSRAGREHLALYLQGRAADVFGVDINPHAEIGSGIMLDHAAGIVVGETCRIADNVSILQGVTLGGTGKECGDRHPKLGAGVMVGAGARVLGNITVGEGAKIGAGSVVLEDVPPHTTVVGVPAHVVGHPQDLMPALSMDQSLDGNDPIGFRPV